MPVLKTKFLPFPELRTERLNMRRIVDSDLERLFALRSNTTIMRYIHRPLAKTPDDASALLKKLDDGIDNGTGITWGITAKEDNSLIGTIGYWRIEPDNFRAEIGYLIDEPYQGKGLMTEAINAVADFGFKEMSLHSIEARVVPSNNASAKLLEKNGFIKEGYFKESIAFNGKFGDAAVYSRLNPHHVE